MNHPEVLVWRKRLPHVWGLASWALAQALWEPVQVKGPRGSEEEWLWERKWLLPNIRVQMGRLFLWSTVPEVLEGRIPSWDAVLEFNESLLHPCWLLQEKQAPCFVDTSWLLSHTRAEQHTRFPFPSLTPPDFSGVGVWQMEGQEKDQDGILLAKGTQMAWKVCEALHVYFPSAAKWINDLD